MFDLQKQLAKDTCEVLGHDWVEVRGIDTHYECQRCGYKEDHEGNEIK